MFDSLPEGDPPLISRGAAHLLAAPCPTCGSKRLFAQTMTQRRDLRFGIPLYRVAYLCGDCGHVATRSDPDDKWSEILAILEAECSTCSSEAVKRTNRRPRSKSGNTAVFTVKCLACGNLEDRTYKQDRQSN